MTAEELIFEIRKLCERHGVEAAQVDVIMSRDAEGNLHSDIDALTAGRAQKHCDGEIVLYDNDKFTVPLTLILWPKN